MAQSNTKSVLYSYSDCSKIRVAPVQVMTYGWVTGGLADQDNVKEHPSGTWTVTRQDSDFGDLQAGLWGGYIVAGA